MISKRLMRLCGKSRKYIAFTVLAKWISLLCGIGIFWTVGRVVDKALNEGGIGFSIVLLVLTCVGVRFFAELLAPRFSHTAAVEAKRNLRKKVYDKLISLGSAYNTYISTSGIIQTAGEGIESLDNYFGKYIPQLFYAVLAPATLFTFISFVSLKAALVLVICVPLIPISIAVFMKTAKKAMKKYWNVYTNLGDTFLENLQGLTELKLFGADGTKHREMNEKAEKFRQITMKVLSLQLNSITIMDVLAYGGAAIGGILALMEYRSGSITLGELIIVALLAAEFFLPLRMLGSFFHVATGAMAVSDKIFYVLDIPENIQGDTKISNVDAIELCGVCFEYIKGTRALNHIDIAINKNDYIAIVGESGCGKSTLAALFTKSKIAYDGTVCLNGQDIKDIQDRSIAQNIGFLSSNSYIFANTIRDNLLMANPNADEKEMYFALNKANFRFFVENSEFGLDTNVGEGGHMLSGGQRQRLALARLFLADKPVFIFDEATSNIDSESEEMIWKAIKSLKTKKTIIIISHRLLNVQDADCIYVMSEGKIKQKGAHSDLIKSGGIYKNMWNAQSELEKIRECAS